MSHPSHHRFPVRGLLLVLILATVLMIAGGNRLLSGPSNQSGFVIHPIPSPTAVSLRDDLSWQRTIDINAPMPDAVRSQLQIDAVARVAPAVISVHRTTGSDSVTGSGVFIDASGLAIASLQTTGDEHDVTVVLSTGQTATATVVRVDTTSRLVLLAVDAEPPAVAVLASEDPRPGSRILTIGNPLGRFTSSVTAGVVSATGVTMPASDDAAAVPGLFQHDAATNPGNEGGPVIDLNGVLVGVELGTVKTTAQNEIVQGWSFAVPVSLLGNLLDE